MYTYCICVYIYIYTILYIYILYIHPIRSPGHVLGYRIVTSTTSFLIPAPWCWNIDRINYPKKVIQLCSRCSYSSTMVRIWDWYYHQNQRKKLPWHHEILRYPQFSYVFVLESTIFPLAKRVTAGYLVTRGDDFSFSLPSGTMAAMFKACGQRTTHQMAGWFIRCAFLTWITMVFHQMVYQMVY